MTQILRAAGMEFSLERKKIKNMYIRVRADGSVCVTAPLRTAQCVIEGFVASRAGWIEKQRRAAQGAMPALDGENEVFLWGERCALDVRIGGRTSAAAYPGRVVLTLPRDGEEARHDALRELYRAQVEAALPELFEKWERIMGVRASERHVRRMKTKWGTCNTVARRVWISLFLAAYPPQCLEYIVVHELCHLLERPHSRVFYGHLGRFLPDWKGRRALLKQHNAGALM